MSCDGRVRTSRFSQERQYFARECLDEARLVVADTVHVNAFEAECAVAFEPFGVLAWVGGDPHTGANVFRAHEGRCRVEMLGQPWAVPFHINFGLPIEALR